MPKAGQSWERVNLQKARFYFCRRVRSQKEIEMCDYWHFRCFIRVPFITCRFAIFRFLRERKAMKQTERFGGKQRDNDLRIRMRLFRAC